MAVTQIKNGFQGGSDAQLLVNPDGSINVNTNGGGSGGNASVGPSGSTPPASSTQVGGVDASGNLHPISVDNNGFVNVNGISTISGPVTTKQEGLDAFQTSQYAIGTTAVEIAPTALPSRSSISITVSADPNIAVYIGNSSSVTTSNGYPLYDGSTLQLDLTDTGHVWAISTQPGQTIAALEIA